VVEAVEQASELFGRGWGSFVLDNDRRHVAVLRTDRPQCAVAHCIHDKVVDRAPAQRCIGEGHTAGFHFEPKPALIGRAFEIFGDLLELGMP